MNPHVPATNLSNSSPRNNVLTSHREVPATCGGDFISSYAQYADVLEIPRTIHEAVGVQLVATLLNRNGVTIKHGSLEIPLDLWTILLSGSGGGRNTLVSHARRLLKAADLEDIVHSTQWGSGQHFYQQMAEDPTGLFIWGEFSQTIKQLAGGNFLGVKEWLTDRYDDLGTPPSMRFRATGKQTDTPPIEFTRSPRTNILATSSEAWFFDRLVEEDSTGGFLPRWIIVCVGGGRRVVPRPVEPDSSLQGELIEKLREISKVKGVADLTKIEALYDDWYHNGHGLFGAQPNQALAQPFWHRHRIHILKLAVIYEVSMSGTLRVTPAAWNRAVSKAAELESVIVNLLRTGMDKTGFVLSKMEKNIRDAGVQGRARTDFTKAFQDRNQRETHLPTLVDTGTIIVFRGTSTGGAPPVVYVHRDHVEAYKKAHPEMRLDVFPGRRNAA